MLLEVRRTDTTSFGWSGIELDVSELSFQREGKDAKTVSYSGGLKSVYNMRHYPEHEIPAGDYEGVRITIPSLRADYWSESGSGSAVIALTSPRTFQVPLRFTAGKRTKLVATVALSEVTAAGTGHQLSDDGLTIEAVQQDLVSPDGFKVAYISHFGGFRFDTGSFVLEGSDDMDDSQLDMRYGPFGTGGEPVFDMRGVSEGQGIVDLGERALSTVTSLPTSGYAETAGIQKGHSYAVITKAGRRAKLRVYDMPESWMQWMGIEVHAD